MKQIIIKDLKIKDFKKKYYKEDNLKMKKFEEILKEKAHLKKIQNAKKTVPPTSKINTSKMASSKVND